MLSGRKLITTSSYVSSELFANGHVKPLATIGPCGNGAVNNWTVDNAVFAGACIDGDGASALGQTLYALREETNKYK
ncbi:MAG: hypothetical protein JWQ02_528 [Capsulimonas sp.]|jgi:hypothetical protein|nr:hypothetical protein [Capsulimonas sp.]